MDNFFDSLESLHEQECLYDEEALSNSEIPFYEKLLQGDNFARFQLEQDTEEGYMWQPKETLPGEISYTSGFDKTPEVYSEFLAGHNNVSAKAPFVEFIPETTSLKESLSWSSVGSSSNPDEESKPSVSSQSKESFSANGKEEQLIPFIEKLQFQLEMLKSENQDLRNHMGRLSQENEILRSQLQRLKQSGLLVSEATKAGSKKRKPEDGVVVLGETNSGSRSISNRKPERRKRTAKSKTLFCFSIILSFLLLPYFFQGHHSLVKEYRGIVARNGSKPVTAIAKYIPYIEETNSSELIGAFQSRQMIKDKPYLESHFPAVRKSFDPTNEHWIRRAVEAAMQLTDSYPEDINNLLIHQKAEDFLRSYASWITHRKGSPTMLVVTRDLVSVLPADMVANATCPDPSSGSCDYSVSLLMPVRSFNESLSDCIYTSLECHLTHGKRNGTLCKW